MGHSLPALGLNFLEQFRLLSSLSALGVLDQAVRNDF